MTKKKRSITEPRPQRPRPQNIRVPILVLFRVFVLGSVAVIASGYAIWRHYRERPMPMLVPVSRERQEARDGPPAPSPSEGIEIDVTPSR